MKLLSILLLACTCSLVSALASAAAEQQHTPTLIPSPHKHDAAHHFHKDSPSQYMARAQAPLMPSCRTGFSLSTFFQPRCVSATCAPFITPPTYMGTVPTPKSVIGFDLGTQAVTPDQSNTLLNAIAKASPRVRTGVAFTSVQGRAMNYAIVGQPERLTDAALLLIRQQIAQLMQPNSTAETLRDIMDSTPAFLWVVANVHGYETSGADASLQLVYDLSDRSDCVATNILDSAIVITIPIQNPDGRVANTRRNANMFDLNRDLLARTQPETDSKIELVRQYFPQLYIDSHEMPFDTFFFPPNDDPIHHEAPLEAVNFINNIYGASVATEFTRQNISFFNRNKYDLFAPEYGDTLGTIGFHAAGMTYEKANADPFPQRQYQQYVAILTSVYAGAMNRDQILKDWHQSFVDAVNQGTAGQLQPNKIYNSYNLPMYQPVPDLTIRHYFILNSGANEFETQLMLRLLQRMDVQVYALRSELLVDDFVTTYAGEDVLTTPTNITCGSYWIPMAQPRKHWIEAVLGLQSYVPMALSYDVTSFSLLMLHNVMGGYSGSVLTPDAFLMPTLPRPIPDAPPTNPRIAVFEWDAPSIGVGTLNYIFPQLWDLTNYTVLEAADIANGKLTATNFDVLLVPDGDPDEAVTELGAAGVQNLQNFALQHGRVIAWLGGTQLLVNINVSTAVNLTASNTDATGSQLRMLIPDARMSSNVVPAINGTAFAWVMYQNDAVMTVLNNNATVLGWYPSGDDEAFGVSGFNQGLSALYATAAIVQENVGNGGILTMFSFDPTFRGWTLGTIRLLWNAIYLPM